MIEELTPKKVLIDPPQPAIVLGYRVYEGCGCTVFIGVRVDNFDTVTRSMACEDHPESAHRFNDLLKWSLADGGSDRPLLDVVEEILVKAVEGLG